MAGSHKTYALLIVVLHAFLLAGCTASTTSPLPTASLGSESTTSDKVDLGAGLGGWGPDRPTFTDQQPASYVTFNSITGNSWGDERNFFQIKEKDSPGSSYASRISASPGKTYTGIVMFENAASPSIAAAVNAVLQIQAPATIVGAGELSALISADNAKPETVWDSVVLTLPDAQSAVALRYVPNTAVVHSSGQIDGQILPNDLYIDGAKMGCDVLNGLVDGSGKCSSYITFDFVLDQPNFTVTTLATSAKVLEFSPSVETTVGDTLTIRAEYRNTGSTLQNNVVLRIVDLPQGMQLLDDPVLFASSSTNGYVALPAGSAGRLADRGLNLGSYSPGGNCFIKFKVKIQDVPGYDFSHDGQIYRFPQIAADTKNGTKLSGVKVLIFGPLQ